MRARLNRALTITLLLAACARGTSAPPTPAATLTAAAYTTPDWFKTAVLYQVFVRSFYDSNGDGIGDLAGVTQKLDYIRALGANTVWLTPIFASNSYHGYDTTDYFTINPDFGTKADLIDLVDSAHARDMHIVLDYVASHTSSQHPFFQDAYGNPASRYSGWYLWKNDAHTQYQSFAGVAGLPTINHGDDAANTYFLDVARYWLDLDGDGDFTDGIDGWRADYALGPVQSFWRLLRASLKPLDPQVLLLGEVWVSEPGTQAGYFEGQFDALFDFPLYGALMDDPQQDADSALLGVAFTTRAKDFVDQEQQRFPPQAIPVRFLANHDTDRLATELATDPARLRLAPLLLAALPGTPMVYYGEEIGMAGHKGGGPIYDEYRREPMNWYAASGPGQPAWFAPEYSGPGDGVSVEEQAADPASLLNAYRAAFALRASSPALVRGAYRRLPAEPAANTWAFWRYSDGQVMAAFFNFGLEPVTLALDLSTAPGRLAPRPRDALTGQAVDASALTLAPGAGLILDWTP